jgi:hypothetical protein
MAEVTGWTLTQSSSTIEDTTLTDTTRSYLSGLSEYSGTVDCHWDETDTNGQVACTIGASVALYFYPEGATSGDTYFSGTALVTGITRNAAIDGLVESSLTFQGTGALSITTV